MSDPQAIPGRLDRKKQARHDALVEAALELFRERGLHGTRVEDITERADVAKGAFYNYFDSKDALVAELLSDAVRVLAEDYLSKLNGAEGPERIEELARLHERFLVQHPTYALLLHQTRGLLLVPTAGGAEQLRPLFRKYLDLIASALTKTHEHSSAEREVAAVLAGGVSGARSFALAAGLKPSRAAAAVLARGVGSALAAGKKKTR